MKWAIETWCGFSKYLLSSKRHFIKAVHKSFSFRNYWKKSPDSWAQWVSRSVGIFFLKGSKMQNVVICSSPYDLLASRWCRFGKGRLDRQLKEIFWGHKTKQIAWDSGRLLNQTQSEPRRVCKYHKCMPCSNPTCSRHCCRQGAGMCLPLSPYGCSYLSF